MLSYGQFISSFVALEGFPLASVCYPKSIAAHFQRRRAALYKAALHSPVHVMM